MKKVNIAITEQWANCFEYVELENGLYEKRIVPHRIYANRLTHNYVEMTTGLIVDELYTVKKTYTIDQKMLQEFLAENGVLTGGSEDGN